MRYQIYRIASIPQALIAGAESEHIEGADFIFTAVFERLRFDKNCNTVIIRHHSRVVQDF
ncbi:hypothetical protein D3C80_1988740 [compost metagenome]